MNRFIELLLLLALAPALVAAIPLAAAYCLFWVLAFPVLCAGAAYGRLVGYGEEA